MQGADQHRREVLERQSERTFASQDIGELPSVKHPGRRKRALASLSVLARSYFPHIFYLPWSKDHLKVILKITRVVKHHEKLAVAMPRGSGKSALSELALVWGALRGDHKYSVLVAATAPKAADSMLAFKAAFGENELLLEDFPEVCYPIHAIENEPRRCRGQRYHGQKTNITWGKDRIILPTIPGSAGSGAVIQAASIDGNIRGMKLPAKGGAAMRPTLAMCDDPQTPESARSQGPNGQCAHRLKVIIQDVQGLAGPSGATGILVPCTVIEPGDLADQILKRPDYRGERTKRIYSWPSNKPLWEEYRALWESLLRSGQPPDESNVFYRERMATCRKRMDTQRPCEECARVKVCMDAGAVVDWAERIDADAKHLSAVQTAMHSFYEYGPVGFAAEFQNEPITNEPAGRLSADLCASRVSGRPWGEVPIDCTELTMGVDVQQTSLWYVVLAARSNFTAQVVEYGVWPEQKRTNYTLGEISDSLNNLQTKYPHRGVEGTIQAGLEDLVTWALRRNFQRSGGAGLARIGRLLVDSGKWPNVIAAVKMSRGGSAMQLSKGVGIRAGTKPMIMLKPKPGDGRRDLLGHWMMPATQGTKEFPHVAVDTNFWKSFVHSAFLTAPGDPGAFTLFGDDPTRHALFASHITAEYYTTTQGHGREVQEWTVRPNRPDNHFLDALVLAVVGASMQGCSLLPGGIPRARSLRHVAARVPARSFDPALG